jgi:hypothetical protein
MKVRQRKLLQKNRITVRLAAIKKVAAIFNRMTEAEWDSFVPTALRQYLKGQQ